MCDDVETLVKMRVAVKDVRPSTLRSRLLVGRMRFASIVPNVDKLSYNTIANKLLPTLAFDPVDVDGRNPQGMVDVRSHDSRASTVIDSPMTMDELDKSIDNVTRTKSKRIGSGIASFRPNNNLKTS